MLSFSPASSEPAPGISVQEKTRRLGGKKYLRKVPKESSTDISGIFRGCMAERKRKNNKNCLYKESFDDHYVKATWQVWKYWHKVQLLSKILMIRCWGSPLKQGAVSVPSHPDSQHVANCCPSTMDASELVWTAAVSSLFQQYAWAHQRVRLAGFTLSTAGVSFKGTAKLLAIPVGGTGSSLTWAVQSSPHHSRLTWTDAPSCVLRAGGSG